MKGTTPQAKKGATAGRRGPLIIAAVVAAAVVVGVLVALSASGGDDEVNTDRASGTVLGVAEVRTELDGIPQSGARLGAADAPVRIEEYGDMQCPFCAQASAGYVGEIVERFVRPGQASITFRTLAFIGPDSQRGAFAVQAAAQQNRMWDMAGVLYRNQGAENAGWLSDDLIADSADALGLDRDRLDTFRTSAAAADAVAEDGRTATSKGITSTPSFVVTGPGGTEVLTAVEGADQIAAAIEKVRG